MNLVVGVATFEPAVVELFTVVEQIVATKYDAVTKAS